MYIISQGRVGALLLLLPPPSFSFFFLIFGYKSQGLNPCSRRRSSRLGEFAALLPNLEVHYLLCKRTPADGDDACRLRSLGGT